VALLKQLWEELRLGFVARFCSALTVIAHLAMLEVPLDHWEAGARLSTAWQDVRTGRAFLKLLYAADSQWCSVTSGLSAGR